MSGLVFVGGGGASVQYIDGHVYSGSNVSSHTFNDIDLGPNYSNGLNVFGLTPNGTLAVAISSITVNGNAATNIVSVSSGGVQAHLFAIPGEGGTGDVAINLSSGTMNQATLLVWKLRGLRDFAAHDFDSSTSTSISFDVPKNGVGVAYVFDAQVGAGFVWTGLTKDDEVLGSSIIASGASDAFDTAQSPLNVTMATPAPNFRRLVGASWR